MMRYVVVAAAMAVFSSRANGVELVALVPKPSKVEWMKGVCPLDATTRIVFAGDGSKTEAEMLAEALRPPTGLPLPIVPMPELAGKLDNAIVLSLDASLEDSLGSEGYKLEALPTPIVRISAATTAGLFYGGQTLRQLLPPAIFLQTKQPGVQWNIACCKIEDKPRFPWRGLLLDEGRHFFGKAFVLRYLDLLASQKLNVLHWHLTEDQGWRIEIKKYPKLTEIGSWRDQTEGDGKRYGGFYTQDEIREVVAYAAKRHITIVPEIEMPGHSLGALTAYPQFSCTGGPFKVRTKWGIEADVYCAGNDATFTFVEDILDEVIGLFPSTFIHIGGDECPKSRWKTCPKCQARVKVEGLKNEQELQSYFIHRIEKHLASKGRRLIGWDEILEGGMPPKATVMSWHGLTGALAAAKTGHDYVATPTSHCYLDYPITSVGLEKVYTLDPAPAALSPTERTHCLGVQGNMWTERTPTPESVDEKVWPRLCALAEIGWSPPEGREWSEFSQRMTTEAKRLEDQGIKIRIPSQIIGKWRPSQMSERFEPLKWDATKFVSEPGTYEVEVAYVKGKCGVAIASAELLRNGGEAVRDAHEAFSGARTHDNIYKLEVGTTKPGDRYELSVTLRSDGGTDSSGVVRIKRLP